MIMHYCKKSLHDLSNLFKCIQYLYLGYLDMQCHYIWDGSTLLSPSINDIMSLFLNFFKNWHAYLRDHERLCVLEIWSCFAVLLRRTQVFLLLIKNTI